MSKKLFMATLLLTATGCGFGTASYLKDNKTGVDYTDFDSYCRSYDRFPQDDKGNAIRYTIDRVKFVAGVETPGAEGCNGITVRLMESIREEASAAHGQERYVFRLGVRLVEGNTKFKADPGEIFKLKDLSAFHYFRFITHIYLPHGEIENIEPLGNLNNLVVMDLRNNRIAELGDALLAPSKLEYLDLSFNQIKSTRNIGGDNSLRFLDISNNPIESIEGLKSKTKLNTYFGPEY